MCQEYEIENEIIPRIASCFGGGIANMGGVCGAVAGAVMAIGLKKERGDTIQDWDRISVVVQEFRRRFEAEVGSINCRELTGADLSTEEGREQYMGSDTPMTVCFPAVDVAYRLVMGLLKEAS